MNTHKNHVASCLCCEFLMVSDAERGYSEYTPGGDMGIACLKQVFDFDEYSARDGFDKLHDLGSTCKHFQAKD